MNTLNELVGKLDIPRYYSYNGFYEIGISDTLELHILCRNSMDGKYKYHKKYISNNKRLKGEEFNEWLRGELYKFIKLKTQGIYYFVPYELKEAENGDDLQESIEKRENKLWRSNQG